MRDVRRQNMEMLTEIDAVRQYPGERKRRWFTSPQMDLFVWMGRGQAPVKFQLCYDKHQNEKALTWSKAGGYTHENVDPGEPVGLGYKKAAVLVADGAVDANDLAVTFAMASANLPNRISRFVLDKLRRHPSYGKGV